MCGIYAIATIACLAFGEDPTTMVLDQAMLKPHQALTLATLFQHKSC